MKFLRCSLIALALCSASLVVSGCLWLAIPSLAYQGYKYEKDKGSTSESASAQKTTKPANSSQQTISPNDIE